MGQRLDVGSGLLGHIISSTKVIVILSIASWLKVVSSVVSGHFMVLKMKGKH